MGSFDDVILGSADDNSFMWGTNYVFLPLWPLSHNGGLAMPLSWMVANLCEKNPGCLVYIGCYTTQLCRDYNKPLQGSLLTNQYSGK